MMSLVTGLSTFDLMAQLSSRHFGTLTKLINTELRWLMVGLDGGLIYGALGH